MIRIWQIIEATLCQRYSNLTLPILSYLPCNAIKSFHDLEPMGKSEWECPSKLSTTVSTTTIYDCNVSSKTNQSPLLRTICRVDFAKAFYDLH